MMLYDAGKIIAGLVIFAAFFTVPFWYGGGKTSEMPKLELTAQARQAGQCVEPKERMRQDHMQLLDDWRDAAVRDGNRTYTSSTGKSYTVSLQNTCMDCHSNKDKFCDRCHGYMGVSKLYCWDCHLDPTEEKTVWASTDGNS